MPVAFPAISCGIYDYPIEDAATIAVREVRAFLELHHVPGRVVLVAFDQALFGVIHDALSTITP